jgi:cytochrome c-type biogenesis protein
MSGGVDVLPDGEGGVAVKAAPAAAVRPRVPIMPMVLFVSGFAIVFTAFGVAVGQAPTGWLNRTLHSEGLLRIAGAFVLLFGVAMILYALRVGSPSLYAERRPFLSKVRPGPAGALPLGMAFALGWTPCIGPVLGAILTIAATQGGALRGGGLLLLYSLGLGLPFLLIGLGVRRLVRVFDVIKRNYRWLAAVSGVVMVAIGFLLVSGLWSSWVTPWLNRLSNVTPPL